MHRRVGGYKSGWRQFWILDSQQILMVAVVGRRIIPWRQPLAKSAWLVRRYRNNFTLVTGFDPRAQISELFSAPNTAI